MKALIEDDVDGDGDGDDGRDNEGGSGSEKSRHRKSQRQRHRQQSSRMSAKDALAMKVKDDCVCRPRYPLLLLIHSLCPTVTLIRPFPLIKPVNHLYLWVVTVVLTFTSTLSPSLCRPRLGVSLHFLYEPGPPLHPRTRRGLQFRPEFVQRKPQRY